MIYKSNYYNNTYMILNPVFTSPSQENIKYFNFDGTMGQVNPEETLYFAPVAILTEQTPAEQTPAEQTSAEQSTGGGSGQVY